MTAVIRVDAVVSDPAMRISIGSATFSAFVREASESK
jgi:hypothetical protein